jgi:hypothetical protein
MHFCVTFELFGAAAVQKEVGDELRAQFKGKSWVRPLGETYIIKITSVEEREEIRRALVEVAQTRKARNQRVLILISPVIEAGDYAGFLPKDMWGKINLRTRTDAG